MKSVSFARLCVTALAFAWLGAVAAEAQTGPASAESQLRQGVPGVVVELFTSQGCSACPPADDLLARLARRPGVIPLALHVDYWDYIGWRDSFAQAGFTERQKSYARAKGSRSIFTPQMIVAGRHQVAGMRSMELADMLRDEAAAARPVTLDLTRAGSMLSILARAEAPLPRPVVVDLVRYTPRAEVDIRAGENAGRRVAYHNIVTLWQTLGSWDGRDSIAFHVRIDGEEPVVVIVQENGPGPVLAASVIR